MRLLTGALTGISLMTASIIPAQVAAEAKIYPYHAANYCPAGYQPVQIAGVICCGQPNQHMSYNQALAHPAPKRHKVKHVVRSARPTCQPGTKGCVDG